MKNIIFIWIFSTFSLLSINCQSQYTIKVIADTLFVIDYFNSAGITKIKNNRLVGDTLKLDVYHRLLGKGSGNVLIDYKVRIIEINRQRWQLNEIGDWIEL